MSPFCGINKLGEGKIENGHPKWYPPQSNPDVKGLMLNNALTGKKERFVPTNGRQVRWYNCGPTVYDYSHMGHARTYLTFDILRRIMEDYLHYDILYQVNITDIDDKIILRARHNELIRRYKEESKSLDQVKADVQDACTKLRASHDKKIVKLQTDLAALKAADNSISKDIEDTEAALLGEQHKLSLLTDNVLPGIETAGTDIDAIIEAARDPLAKFLDAQFGHTVTDHSIFDAHAKKFELEFMKDMEALGIREPDVLTRVTEYVPHIIRFVEKIIARGLAYANNGSVYLDLEKFKQKYDYRKLSPSNEDTSESDLAESEGALGGGGASEKRNKNDFALWKASKTGEPAWESPWGSGRPGWHIECSVVASDILGERLDLHTGGVDLKFPHHDNEIAQSEACFDTQQWVNYFAHAGHLHIKGLKMSKSLKNFITIQQALEVHTPRQIRIMFLLQPWDKSMNYSDQAVNDAKSKEATLKHFFGKVKALAREDWLGNKAGVGWRIAGPNEDKEFEANAELANKLLKAQNVIHESILDNFNTTQVMVEIMDLVSAANVYMQQRDRPSVYLISKIGRYITKMLKVFGVVTGNDDIGFSVAGGQDVENTVTKYIDTFVEFRHDVRQAALEKKTPQEILGLTDDVRDDKLVQVGIRLEDRSGQASVWSLDEPSVLMKEVEERKQKEREAKAKKVVNKIKNLEKDLSKAIAASVLPSEMFRGEKEKYSEFNDEGLPTKDAKGEDLSKKAGKKAKQMFDKQTKLRADLVEKAGGDIEAYLESIRQSIEALKENL